MKRALSVAIFACIAASAAQAGPPLATDDPTAVEPGHVELIAAAAATERDSDESLQVTALDVAYGLVPSLELDLTISYRDDETQSEQSNSSDSFPLSAGVKWEPLRSEHFSLALAPSIALDADGTNLSGTLPVLVEWRAGRFRAGASAAYLPARHASDGWQAGVYGGLGVGEGSELLAEIYSQAFEDRGDPEVGFNAGFDLALTKRIHLLASAGTGIRGGSGSRRDWTAYGGVQLLLGPFGGGPDPSPSSAPERPASLADTRLLELTNRQLRRGRDSGALSRATRIPESDSRP